MASIRARRFPIRVPSQAIPATMAKLAIAPTVPTLRRVPSVASVGDMGDARLAAQAVTTQATTPKVWCLATGARMVVTLALTDISRGPIQAGAPRPRHATTMVMR